MFFFLDSKIPWGLDKSIHAFAHDILFRARSKEDIQTVFEAFDSPAREWGLDMNVNKTELHLIRGMTHIDISSPHGGPISTRDRQGFPQSVYKYLGLYFYTTSHAEHTMAFVKAEIDSLYAHLASLGLTASELIMLTNKQLIPTVAYRLLAGPVTDTQLDSLEKCIWRNISQYGRLPKGLSPKDKHRGPADGCLGFLPFATFMRSQVFNYSMRYLNNDGPEQSNHWVRKAPTSSRQNWLQNSFVDATQALDGKCHGFGPWNLCKASTLRVGEEVFVGFNSGWFTGSVIGQPDSSSALLRFSVDNTEFQIRDRHHNISLHPPTTFGPSSPPYIPAHLQLAPHLYTLPPPLPTLAIPYRSQFIDTTKKEGFLFKYEAELLPPQVSDLQSWGCMSVLSAVEHVDSQLLVWLYIDSSSDKPLTGSAAVFPWPDGTVLVLAIPSSYHGSRDAEFRAFVQATRHLQLVDFVGSIFCCIDNSQVGDCVDWHRSTTPFPQASQCTQGTWQRVVQDLLWRCRFTVGAGRLKSHVGFQGNELADVFAKYILHASTVTFRSPQYPRPHTVTLGDAPIIHKFSGAQRRRLYPKHDHTGISVALSFNWSRHYSWFSSFADKWVVGVRGLQGSSPYWDFSE